MTSISTTDMVTRRNFIGGLSLLAVTPAAVKHLDLRPGESKEIEPATMAELQEIEKVGPLLAGGIRAALVARINAHQALFGEPPKALFVNSREATEYENWLSPQVRYEITDVSKMGYQNLLFKGIPVISTDHMLRIPEGQLNVF